VVLAAAVCGCWAAFYDFAMAVEAQLSFRIVQVPQCTLRPGANRHRKVGASSLSEWNPGEPAAFRCWEGDRRQSARKWDTTPSAEVFQLQKLCESAFL